MKIRNEKSIATIYDAVSILKGLDIINGSLKQNYYAESALFVPDRFINPLILRPKIDISDPSGSIPNGDKVDELSRLEWFENGVKINSNDDFKIEGANLTVFKNSEEPFEISYRAEWFDSRKKQVITIEDSVVVSCISLAQSDANVTMSLSKPQNWVHNPLKGERIYTINAYVSKDKVHESAVEWYYVDSNKKDKLIDSSCSFYVEGQYTNALKVDSAYMDNVIIKAKNISNDKLKEVYWFFDKHGNPLTYAMPDKTIIEGKDVFSLPESPITSKLDYRINGLTIEQLVKNGDFSDGKTGWTLNKVEINNKGNVEFKGNWSSITQPLKASKNDIIYIDSLVESKSEVELCFYYNSLYREKIKVGRNSLCFLMDSGNMGMQNTVDSSGEAVIKYIQAVNLTQTFGKGNEPTKEWCDEYLPKYWEGIKSVQTPIRIKSTISARNIWAGTKDFSRNWVIGRGVKYVGEYKRGDAYSISKGFSPNNIYIDNDFFKTDKEYTISVYAKISDNEIIESGTLGITASSGTGWGVAAKQKEISKEWTRLSWSFVADNGFESLLKFRFEPISTIWVDICLPQLEYGLIPTDWTPSYKDYRNDKDSFLYINEKFELRNIGEVSDYIENEKLYSKIIKLENIDRIKEAVDTPSGIKRYILNISRSLKMDNTKDVVVSCDILNNIPKSTRSSSSVDAEGITTSVDTKNINWIFVNLKEDKDINDFVKEATIFIVTENETIKNLECSGGLKTQPNNTIFIDNAIQLEEQYQEGVTIKEDYPIQVLESIKVGKEYLDISKAVVKDNLITHPDIENGDNVTIEYIYDENPIRNTNSIAYLVLEDILDEFWLDNVYTYKVTNGEWELVKVTDIEDYEEWLKTEKTSPYTLAPDGVIFGSYEAETKFIRQYPSSLYVDIIAPTRLKEGITQIKARALVGTADGVIENPSKYFDISWYKKSNKAGASDVIIGEGEELTINVADVDRIGIEVESKTIKE